jgi:hypothetical protein
MTTKIIKIQKYFGGINTKATDDTAVPQTIQNTLTLVL